MKRRNILISRTNLLLTCFMILSTFVWAQGQSQDVVHLKNGSIFRGEIVKIENDKSVDLKIRNEQIVHFDASEIQKIVQEAVAIKVVHEKPYEFKERGMYYATALAPNYGISSWNNSIFGIGLHQVVGFQKNRWLGLGLGLGVDTYEIGSGRMFFPLYLQTRGYFTQHRVSPYYSIDIGYGFAKDTHDNAKETDGGRYLYPALGYRFGASGGGNFTMDFGIKLQKGHFLRVNNWGSDDRNVKFRRFAFRLGWLF